MRISKPSATRAEQALMTLRQRILNGDLPGGTRLFEVALAEDLDISRTPIRAALSQLAEEGLLDRAKGGGFVVRRFRLADVIDTIELRGVLEGTVARFAAERGVGEDDLARAQVIIEAIDAVLYRQRIDMERYSQLNSEFHRHLVHMAKSDVLSREIDRVAALPFASPSAFLEDETHVERLRRNVRIAHEQHRAMIEAIAARQGARAESVAREHARAALRNVHELTRDSAHGAGATPMLALLRT